MISRIRGTQDFLDLTLWNFFIAKAKKQLASYHFTEIATPLLESLDLFARGLGQETDVVSKEMFVIAKRDDEDETICLRPEATASTLRAFIENGVQHEPWKVFSHGPMFRYERPQKGRYRQFHQLTIELIGAASISYDVQLIAMLDRFFHEELTLNNYALLINFLGCAADRIVYKEKLRKFLADTAVQAGICERCKVRQEKNILRIFDCKNNDCKQIYRNAPTIVENLCAACGDEWKTTQEQLHILSISFAYDPTLVRGLDYYNKTVFEFASANLGAQNAFCGGGRYDDLAQMLDMREQLPCVGAAIGIERIVLLLEEKKEQLLLPQQMPLIAIMPFAKEQHALCLLIADMLAAAGHCTDVFFDNQSIKSMMRKANKIGASYAIMIGEDEQKNRLATVKNMKTGTQDTIAQTELITYLNR